MKIVHIITGLGDGGAEHTLFKICKYDKQNEHIVISLTDSGKYFLLIKKIGVRVYRLKMNVFSFYKFFSLLRIVRCLKPDVVQTWLVHADFLGSIAAKIAGINNIVWNVRYSKIEIGKAKLTTIFIIKLLAKMSHFIPKSIIFVSKKSKKIYEIEGYDKKKFIFIPNGYDLSILKISKAKKKIFQKEIGFNKKVPCIGFVARYDLMKDHFNLINALAILRLKKIEFYCVLVGTNINKNKILMKEIAKHKLNNYVKLLGPTKNISKVMNWLDVHIQSSRSEGFPNVIAEAMAFKTPCVVTNVGDSSTIVGKTGWVVPPNNPIKLSRAIEKALIEIKTKNWLKRCNSARERVKKKFNIRRMIQSYNKIWINVYKKV